jgi:PAS domain S-box-containing protein
MGNSIAPTDPARGITRLLLLTGMLCNLVVSAVYLISPSALVSLNNRTNDVVMACTEPKRAAGTVVIVDIDEKSLARYGQWPWPRNRLAQLLSTSKVAGATVIGLDLILAEPDRTSPINLRHEPNVRASTARTSANLHDHDQELAETLSAGPFVLGYEFLFTNHATGGTGGGLHPLDSAWINTPDATIVQSRLFTALGVVSNRQMFSSAVKSSGFLNATPDADGILRRVPMLIRFEDRLYPSLTLAMLLQQEKTNQIGIQRQKSGMLTFTVGKRTIAVDDQGNMLVHFARRAPALPRVSAADLLDGTAQVQQLANKCILVGSSAAGLAQTYQTPVKAVQTPVDIQAQVLDNLLTGIQIVRSRALLVWEILFGMLITVSTGLAVTRLGILTSAAVGVASLASTWIGAALIFQTKGILFSPLLPTILVVLNYATLTILKTWKIQLAVREKAEDTLLLLKSSEKNLDSIIKTVPDIIFRLDPAGRITFISPAISKYATAPDALLGQPIFDLVAPADLPKAQYRLNEKRTGQRATHDLELRLLLPHKPGSNGDEVGHFSVSAEGIYQGDTPCPDRFIGTQGIIHDITEQKKLEEKLQQAQKMEVIGSLASGVAHDLNNILAGLVTYPDLLLLELPPGDPLRDKISIIQRSGQRAAAIVQDLLTLARRSVNASEVIDLHEVIADYLASPEFEAFQKQHAGTTIESALAPDLLHIKGSRAHLAKVIMNVLHNAAEAMPTGGTIRLSTYNRYLDTKLSLYEDIPPGEYVCMSVVDEGIGIADEDLHRIFEPFYSKKSMRRSGSGLGMTVIWATIKDHGGHINLQSREGDGTSIELFLPATREQEELPSRQLVLEDYLGRERVLIVDDVPEQQQIAANMLAKLGYDVTTAASGEDAVQYLRSNTVDLVVLDMIMPGGIDGLETYQQIITIHPGLRAIITSGFSESERVKVLLQLGAGAYVQKPYTLEKIGIAVRRELDRC